VTNYRCAQFGGGYYFFTMKENVCCWMIYELIIYGAAWAEAHPTMLVRIKDLFDWRFLLLRSGQAGQARKDFT
jgi:hypothetical protein